MSTTDIATNFLNEHLNIQKQLYQEDSEFRLELLNKMERSAYKKLIQEHQNGQVDILEDFRNVFERDLKCVENIIFHELNERNSIVSDYIRGLNNIKKPIIVTPQKCAICYEIVNDYFHCSNKHPECCCTTCALTTYISNKSFRCPLCAKTYSDKEFRESIVRTHCSDIGFPIELTRKERYDLFRGYDDDEFLILV